MTSFISKGILLATLKLTNPPWECPTRKILISLILYLISSIKKSNFLTWFLNESNKSLKETPLASSTFKWIILSLLLIHKIFMTSYKQTIWLLLGGVIKSFYDKNEFIFKLY